MTARVGALFLPALGISFAACAERPRETSATSLEAVVSTMAKDDAGAAPATAHPPAQADGQAVDIEAARAKLAALPDRALTRKDVCGVVDAPGFRPPAIVVIAPSGGDEGWRIASPEERRDAPAVIGCKPRRDPVETLVASVTCDPKRPVCSFGLASGETLIPPTERRYWFAAGPDGRLEMVAVAISSF